VRVYMFGRGYQSSDIDMGEAASRLITWLAEEATPALTQLIQSWLMLPGRFWPSRCPGRPRQRGGGAAGNRRRSLAANRRSRLPTAAARAMSAHQPSLLPGAGPSLPCARASG
jgi:hypothetical protein